MSDDAHKTFTKAEIESILAREKFVYQRVELPYGLATRGGDRSGTARLIFTQPLTGASVLDIGCCYGFFLYEAEKLGATRLVGTEKNPDRLRQARVVRDIRGSALDLSDDDFEVVCQREAFDVILLLNVIHHLVDPIHALRVLAAAARQRFIVEFPTPDDPRYWKVVSRVGAKRWLPRTAGRLLNRLPAIAVSSLSRNDQTFLFTEKAIRAILLEHERLVDRITFIPSPKPGRMIAVCEK